MSATILPFRKPEPATPERVNAACVQHVKGAVVFLAGRPGCEVELWFEADNADAIGAAMQRCAKDAREFRP